MVFQHMTVDLLKGMIPGGVTVKDFCTITDMKEAKAQNILKDLIKHNTGTAKDSFYYFEDSDRLKMAITLLEDGHQIDKVSEALNWRDFEGLTAQILESEGFAVIRNLVLTKPKREIDVVGIRLGIAILIDCKHWRRHNPSKLKDVVNKQIARTKHYVAKTTGAIAVPVIVTLYEDNIKFIDNVPIVPISMFASFIDEFYGNLDQIKTIKTD